MKTGSLSLLLVAGALACRDRMPVATGPDLAGLVPRGAIQLAVQQETPSGDGTRTFVVRVVSNGVKVGAYQGALTFVPGTLELVAATTPKGANGDFYVVNTAPFAAGKIRFAAYTTQGFGSTEAFRLTVKPLKTLNEAQLTGTLDVAGELTGSRVSPNKLLASRGIRDAISNEVIVP